MVVRYETPSIPGRRTRWLMRQQPQSNAEREARGYTARRLNPEEVATIAAGMGMPISGAHKPAEGELIAAKRMGAK
jgi:hypothetical protein